MEEHDHTLSTRRIEMFSDGIFAIIVTLLVLDLKVPDIAHTLSTQEGINVLINLIPQFIAFALSFLVIAIFWGNHHQFFSTLKYADRRFLWLNNFLLFWLCFIPFPTAFLGRYPTNVPAVMLYGFVLCAAASSFSLMLYHASFRGNLVDAHIPMKVRHDMQKKSYWGILSYGLSVVFAPLSIYISLAIFFIVPLIYFVPQKIRYA